MRCQASIAVILCILLLAGAPIGLAFETDQYRLPPEPLSDIGDEFSQYVDSQIDMAIANLDREIAMHESCLHGTAKRKCSSDAKEAEKLSELRSPETAAKEVYKRLGEGSIFTTVTAKWFSKHNFEHEPSRYKPGYGDSIFITMPLNYVTISPTVKMFGVELGFDKIDHFFQQGYKYYKIYNDAIGDGKTADEASQKAIKWGRRTERTYFGTLVSGVYSNGDLFANYAGMRFYQRLTADVTTGGVSSAALLELREGRWRRTGSGEAIRPFIAEQMNEALNPSGLSFFLYSVVKKIVREKDCPDWRRHFPAATAAEFDARAKSLETWNGEDYGMTPKIKRVMISSCFQER